MPSPSRPPSNGSKQPSGVVAFASASAAPFADDEPMSRVLALDEFSSGAARWLAYLLGSFALLLGLMVTARLASILIGMTNVPAPRPPGVQEVDVVAEEPPPPPPVAPPEQQPEPATAPPPRAAPRAPAPPPASAQAGRVLTQEPDPNEPVDLTGNTIVSGNAEAYAGGTTAANGTSPTAVRGPTSPQGVGAPTPRQAYARIDHSRKASVGGSEWNAPFPPEADEAQINDAFVGLQVEVRPDGSPASVKVLKDPGNGFGREARRYALGRRFQPALDREGNPIASTLTITVHFSR